MEPKSNGQNSSGNESVPPGSNNFDLNNKPDTPPTYVTAPAPIVISPTAGNAQHSRDQHAAQLALESSSASNNQFNAPPTVSTNGYEAPPAVPTLESDSKIANGLGAVASSSGLPQSASYASSSQPPNSFTPNQMIVGHNDGGGGMPASSGGSKLPRRKLMIGGTAASAVLLIGLGYVLGFYIPNKPANVFQTGLDRSGDNLSKLVKKFTDKEKLEKLQNSEITATAEAKYPDFSFNGSFGVKLAKTKSDGSLDIRFKSGEEAEKKLNLKFLTDLPEDKIYPNIYFQLNGLRSLGLDVFISEYLAYDGKWIAVDSDYLESVSSAGDAPKNKENLTSAEVADLIQVITDTTNEYLLTSDKDKAVLENRSFTGKETVDGIKTYRYQVGINKAHAKDYCRVLSERVVSHAVSRKLANLDDGGVEEQKKNISESCDRDVDSQIKDDMTMDLWIDAKYKLVHKLRIYDDRDKNSYTDFGQIYKGGNNISFFINSHQDKAKSDAKFIIDVDTKAYTSKGSFTWTTAEYENSEVKITFEAKPYDGEVKADKPADAISIQEIMKMMGIEPPEPRQSSSGGSSGSIQSKAKDTERQTDIKAMHGQLEAYYAQNGYYPSLANFNNPSWRSKNMRGLDGEALKDPDGTQNVLAAKATKTQYGYTVTGCAPADQCTGYKLEAVLSSGSTYEKNALN